MNKLIFSLALLCSSLIFVACEQDGVTLSFDLPYSTDFTLKAADFVNTNGVAVDVNSPAVSTDAATLGDQGTQLDKLESAKLNSAVITITAPDGQTFAFMKDIKIYIKGQGLTEQLLASALNVSETATSLTMIVEDTELVEHIKSGEFSSRASISTDSDLDNDCELKADISFKVKASAL